MHSCSYIKITIVIAFIICVFHSNSIAHVVPVDQIGHHIQIAMFKDKIIVDYAIVQSELADVKEMIMMNTDGNYEISQAEKESYYNKKKDWLKTNLEIMLDGKTVVLVDLGTDISAPQVQSYKFILPISDTTKITYEISVYNKIPFTRAENLKYYITPEEGITVTKEERWQKDNNDIGVDQGIIQEKRGIILAYTTGKPVETSTLSPGNREDIKGTNRLNATNKLRSIINEPNISFRFAIIALIVSAFLGGLHAITPGHGKTIVAAYLVGTEGRVIDAVFLGIIVTITHTLSVIILGLIVLYASQYILPQDLFPYIGISSGLLIIIVGGWLLVRNIRHGYVDEHEHSHQHNILGLHHHHESETHHNHHEDDINDHHHDDDKEIHQPKEKSGVTFWSMVSLGISGGIIPCPDAIVVLLIAVALNRIAFGLLIIMAFSIGLAAVLIIIGIMIVLAKSFLDKSTGVNRWTRALPIASAAVVIILGFVITIKALVSNGIITINI